MCFLKRPAKRRLFHNVVDPWRIELQPRQCECRVIPLYYGPNIYFCRAAGNLFLLRNPEDFLHFVHRKSFQFPPHAKKFACFIPVGLLGIEPSLRTPEARVLPVYYSPNRLFNVMLSFYFINLLRFQLHFFFFSFF